MRTDRHKRGFSVFPISLAVKGEKDKARGKRGCVCSRECLGSLCVCVSKIREM